MGKSRFVRRRKVCCDDGWSACRNGSVENGWALVGQKRVGQSLVQADITTRGRADSILKAAHITRSRYAHEVSACALYILQRKACKEYTVSRYSSNIDF